MCGRFAMDDSTNELLEEIVEQHGIRALGEWSKHWPPRYNTAPTQDVPVARERNGQREIASVRWGMVPPRAQKFGAGKPIINARLETVATNGMFKAPFASHRCIVAAAGYYEWQLRDDGKQPYFVHQPGRPIAMAAIIRSWADPSKAEGDPDTWRLSMAIITRDAHVAPGEVHDRMPACLAPDAVDDWLGDHLGPAELVRLLDRSSTQVAYDLAHYPVSREVNNTRNEGEGLIAPQV